MWFLIKFYSLMFLNFINTYGWYNLIKLSKDILSLSPFKKLNALSTTLILDGEIFFLISSKKLIKYTNSSLFMYKSKTCLNSLN